jgi:asparagine synthase (glutamine-hydrolysing)
MGKAKRYIRRARIPMPERLESFNHFGAIPGDRVFTAEIARRVDTHGPIGTMQRHYHALDGASMLDRMMFLDMQTTIADDDLRKVNRTAEANGIEVRYPLLDDEVVDFSTRLPESLQLKGGELRWFFKHAMRDILPVSTLTKSKHGFGLPFDLWIRTDSALRDYAYGKLDALSRRGIFQRELIETTIAAHRRGDLHSHGQLVWALLLLELWFETRHDDVTGAAVRIAATA